MDTQYISIWCNEAEKLPSNLSSSCPLSCDVFCCLFFAWPLLTSGANKISPCYKTNILLNCLFSPPSYLVLSSIDAHKVVLTRLSIKQWKHTSEVKGKQLHALMLSECLENYLHLCDRFSWTCTSCFYWKLTSKDCKNPCEILPGEAILGDSEQYFCLFL